MVCGLLPNLKEARWEGLDTEADWDRVGVLNWG